MSEDRDRFPKNDELGEENDDVEAHKLAAQLPPKNEDGDDGGDDVEAHKLA